MKRYTLIQKNSAHGKKKLLRGARYSVGIDEVGRGSLAGPVTVAAVAVLANSQSQIANRALGRLRDSKRLSPKQRDEWFRFIRKHPHISYAIARVYPRGIERMNISRAANLAALRAFQRLSTRYSLLSTRCLVYLDGGLYLGSSKWQSRHKVGTPTEASGMANSKPAFAKTVVRGDEKYTAIKLASIVAKVSRDRFMVRLAKKYPQYGFEVHKGYGTKMHFRALKKNGPSKAHRLTFIGK